MTILHFVAVAGQEVELDSGKETDHYYDHNGVNGAGRAYNQATAGGEWNVWFSFVGEDRQRKKGKGSDIDQQAGAYNEPVSSAAQVPFTNHGKLAARHARPDGSE